MAQCVYERAGSALGIGAGEIEGAQDAVLQGPAGHSLAVLANKQWCAGRPAVQLIVARAAAGCWLLAAVVFVGWMFLPAISDQVLRVEVGYAGATALLAAALTLLYRRGGSPSAVTIAA